MALHTCPVCGNRHEVHPVLVSLGLWSSVALLPALKVLARVLVKSLNARRMEAVKNQKHADQLYRLRKRLASGRHGCRGNQRLSSQTGIASSGLPCAMRHSKNWIRCRRSLACTNWRSRTARRAAEDGDSVFAVMHLLEEDKGEFNIGEVNVFVGQNYVLSVRNHSQQGFLGGARTLRAGATFAQSWLRLRSLCPDGCGCLYRYFPIMDRLESELEEIEEQVPRARPGAY